MKNSECRALAGNAAGTAGSRRTIGTKFTPFNGSSEYPERRGNNRDVSAERCRYVATVPGTPGSYSWSDPREDARTPAGGCIAFPRHVGVNDA